MALTADSDTRTLYSGSTDGTIRTWDLSLYLCKRTIPGKSDVLSLGLAPAVTKWRKRLHEKSATTATNFHSTMLQVLVAGFADGLIHVIDRVTYCVRRVLSAGPDPVHCVALVPGLRMVVAGTCKGRIATWQVCVRARARVCACVCARAYVCK